MLELDKIIQEACVRLVWDQWHIPRSFSFTRQVITEEASELRRFLNLLNSTPYSDSRLLIVTCTNIKTFAARALASLWEDLTVGPMDRDERLSWWMERFEILREGFEFLEWVDPLAREEGGFSGKMG